MVGTAHVFDGMPDSTRPTTRPAQSERLPYYRLDDPNQRLALQQKGAERARDLIVTLPTSARFRIAESLCRSIAQLSATEGRDPLAAPDYGELPDVEGEMEVELESAEDVRDVTGRVIEEAAVPREQPVSDDRFEPFRQAVPDEGWTRQGIGPVRTLYYLSFLGSRNYDSDLMEFGDFPRSPHRTVPQRLHQLDGVHASIDAQDWLAYDLYLEHLLHVLGVSWLTVEDAIVRAFYKNLPAPYQTLLANVPKPLWFVLWKHDLEKWVSFQRHGARIQKAVESLSTLLRKTPLAPQYERGLGNLRRAAAPAEWTVGEEDRLRDRCVPGSPIIKAVYKTVAKSLWRAIQKHASDERDPPAPAPLARILRQAETSTKRRPIEFWKLLVDIFYHLPIARGLPDQRRFVDEMPKREPPHTQNAIRLIVSRS